MQALYTVEALMEEIIGDNVKSPLYVFPYGSFCIAKSHRDACVALGVVYVGTIASGGSGRNGAMSHIYVEK